jgi:hypothetical protein
MQEPQKCAIHRRVGTVEIHRQVIRCHGLEYARGIGAIQVQPARHFALNLHARQQRNGAAVAFGIQHLGGARVAMLALANQAVAEIRPHVESVIAIVRRELQLPLRSETPQVIDNCGSTGRLFALAGIDRIAGGARGRRDQPG